MYVCVCGSYQQHSCKLHIFINWALSLLANEFSRFFYFAFSTFLFLLSFIMPLKYILVIWEVVIIKKTVQCFRRVVLYRFYWNGKD